MLKNQTLSRVDNEAVGNYEKSRCVWNYRVGIWHIGLHLLILHRMLLFCSVPPLPPILSIFFPFFWMHDSPPFSVFICKSTILPDVWLSNMAAGFGNICLMVQRSRLINFPAVLL